MAESSAGADWPALPESAPDLLRPPRPKVVVKGDLLPAFSALSLIALLGLPLGWAWSRLAPAERVRVLRGDELAPLPMEVWHEFTGIAVFLLLGLAAGTVVGVAAWYLRGRRGPVLMLAAVAGSAVSAVFATRMGTAFANGRYAVEQAPQLGAVVEQAPALPTAWVLIAQPLATAFVYGILAVWNSRDDLGRRLG